MPDEEPKVETTEEPKTETVKPVEQPTEEEFDKERAMATISKLREFEKQAKQLQKKLDAFEQQEAERKKAELSETERLQADLKEAQTQLETLRITETKRRIAAEVGLPETFAPRIQGNDEEAMKADAQALLEAMPKAEVKTIKAASGNVVSGQAAKETDAQRRARIYGQSTDVFDPDWAKAHGGGVIWNSEESKQ